MTELNTFRINKFTLNSGDILLDDVKKAIEVRDILERLDIRYNIMIIKNNNIHYYGFKVFRMKRQLLKLCVELKGVFG